MTICHFMKRTIPAGRRGASRCFPKSDITSQTKDCWWPLMGSRPTQAKGEAVLLPSPGHSFLAAGLWKPQVVWFGASNAGGHSEFKELGVPFILHPGLTIHKSDSPRLCWPPLQLRPEGEGLTQEQRMACQL